MELQSKDTVLFFKVIHSKPIEIGDFVETMKSIQFLFEEFAQENADFPEVRKAKLYVEKIEHGSIEFFLAEVITATVLPFVENFNLIFEFSVYLKEIVSGAIRGRNDTKLSISELKALRGIFSMTANDAQGSTEFGAMKRNSQEGIFNNCVFNFYEGNTAQNQLSREIENRQQDAPVEVVHKAQLMKIYQMRGDMKSSAGNMAIIDALCPRSLKVYFADDLIKKEILGSSENPTRQAYIVDVILQTIEGKPFSYKVVALHEVLPLEE